MRHVLFICLFLLPTFSLHAEELSALHTSLNNKLADPVLLKEAIASGEDRASVCKFCHGADGNSKRDYIPNLAEQNPKYLLKQFELFASKQRKNKIMSELAKNLSGDDRVNISLFYSSQKLKTDSGTGSKISTNGKKTFQARCSVCHGENGHGKEELPRIASQPEEYLIRTLNSYRNKPDFRPNSPMQAIVTSLNKSDQSTVVSFVSSMK